MENSKSLKLTNTVYKLLEFFPESDPLKNRAKDRALVIMEHLFLINENSGWVSFQKDKIRAQLTEDIDVLLGYLWIGKTQGWLNSVNCLIISNEYEKIKNSIQPIIELTQKLPGIDKIEVKQEEAIELEPINNQQGISTRQEKILEFLIKNKKAQVMDIQTILPNVTKRTIRRDLDELLEADKVVRSGDFNQVFYHIK